MEHGASIGSDSACDIVLCDEGIPAHAGWIHLHEAGWLFTSVDTDSDSTDTVIPWNQAIPLGESWITVAPVTALWEFSPVNKDTGNTAEPLVSNIPAEPITPVRTFLASTSTRSWTTLALCLTIGVAIFFAIVFLLNPYNVSSPNSSTNTHSAEQSLGKISAALDRLGVSSSVHATLSRTGSVTVSGWARDRPQYDAIASALSQIWPMPAMRISLESDAIVTARAALQRFSVKYDPLYQGNGRLEIVGVASTARERASALDAVRAQLPGMTVFGNTIELSQDVGASLAEKITSLGIAGVTLTWFPGHLTVQPPDLSDAQAELLEKTIIEFNQHYWNIAQLGVEPTPTTADTVPFEIRSIMSGPQPFIVLADGSKLLIGGTYKRYQLIAIEDSRIIFDGPHRAIVSR